MIWLFLVPFSFFEVFYISIACTNIWLEVYFGIIIFEFFGIKNKIK